MKRLNRVEKKFLWSSVELYRYDSGTETFDVKHTFWLRTVKQIYYNDEMYGCWIDGKLWVVGSLHSLFQDMKFRVRAAGFCDVLQAIASQNQISEKYADFKKSRSQQ
jgi:hypothetical protein